MPQVIRVVAIAVAPVTFRDPAMAPDPRLGYLHVVRAAVVVDETSPPLVIITVTPADTSALEQKFETPLYLTSTLNVMPDGGRL